MGMRITSPIESGAGSSGSMGGFGIDSAGAGLGEVVLMRGEFMVLHRLGKLTEGYAKPDKISAVALPSYLLPDEAVLSNIKLMFLRRIACSVWTPPWVFISNPSFLLFCSTSFAGSVTITFLFRVKVT